jgi:hypothetical protein
LICYNMGLVVSAHAKTINETKEILARISANRLKPHIAIISSMIEVDLNDGRKLATKLREMVPGIKIIAYSLDKEDDWGDKIAVKTTKESKDSVISALEDLTGHSFKFSNLP